jgi:ubiquinone/menaquinone biosynthesis C-methylase UbiE
MVHIKNQYTEMQLREYNRMAEKWSESDRDWVVGSFDEHNNWEDYELLFRKIKNPSEKIGLDFGCGPGRNLVKYARRFKQLDGVDISPINILKAKQYTSKNNVKCDLYVNNGIDLSIIESNKYDFVMSAIVLQHICVYDIRYFILKDIYRILKPGGIITIQMGFGCPSPDTVEYYENYYEAPLTNRGCDVAIHSPVQLKKDLMSIGYKNFTYLIGPVGPGDKHPFWIYFNAYK